MDTVLFGVVHHFLSERWSPSQIAGTLKRMWLNDPQRTVLHETVYNCIYAMLRGELRKDLITCLRMAQSKRMPRTRGKDRRGQLPEVLSIHVRPPAVHGYYPPISVYNNILEKISQPHSSIQ